MDPRSHLPRAHRRVAWSKDGGLGAEFALVDFGPDDLRADGFAIGFEPEPYRLEFVADVIFDADGLVVDYPGIAARFRGNAPGSPERVTQHAVAFNAAVQSGAS